MAIYVPGKLTLRQQYIGTDDPDAAAYITAVEAADGESLETTVQVAIHSFVKGCKADGIWPALKASCIMAGARTLNGALVPLVGTAPTNINFVAGDYDRETGLKGNGSTKYLNSNRNNNADPQDDNHNAVYATFVQATNTVLMAAADPATAAGAGGNVLFTLGASRCRANTASAPPAVPPSIGLIGFSRSIGASYNSRYSGSTNIISISSDGLLSQDVLIFRRQSAAPSYTTSRLSFYSIGESLDLALLDARVTDLMTAIGAAIP